jgi:hypothetical protein
MVVLVSVSRGFLAAGRIECDSKMQTSHAQNRRVGHPRFFNVPVHGNGGGLIQLGAPKRSGDHASQPG